MPVDSAEQGITHIITHYRGSTRSASAHRREGDRFESRIVKSRWNALAKTGATHYHAQLGLVRQRSCNERDGCLMGVT